MVDFERGSIILKGMYLKKVERNKTGYIFEENKPHKVVMQYSHHVIATHLPFSLMKRHGKPRQRWWLGINDHGRLPKVLALRADRDI